jgi:MFS family permease
MATTKGPAPADVLQETSRRSTPSPSIHPPHAPLYTFDSSIIQLEGDEDPRNWSSARKWYTTSVISLMGFISPLGSSIIVPGGPFIGHDFHVPSRTLSLLSVSFFILGLGIGPFLLAPASEMKGRHPIYLGSSAVFVLLNLGSTLVNNFPGLVVLRFLAGAAGSTGPSLGAGSIVSVHPLHLTMRCSPSPLFSLPRATCLALASVVGLNLCTVWVPC